MFCTAERSSTMQLFAGSAAVRHYRDGWADNERTRSGDSYGKLKMVYKIASFLFPCCCGFGCRCNSRSTLLQMERSRRTWCGTRLWEKLKQNVEMSIGGFPECTQENKLCFLIGISPVGDVLLLMILFSRRYASLRAVPIPDRRFRASCGVVGVQEEEPE